MLRLLLIACLVAGAGDRRGASAAEAKTQVLILGVVHLDNPGRDVINFEFKNILGDRRQKEIREVVERLKAFRPTKVAVEASAESTPVLQRRLDQYVAGKYVLKADELDQIAVRIAKETGIKKLDCIDYGMDLDFDRTFAFAQKNGQGPLLDRLINDFKAKMKPRPNAEYLEQHSIREILLDANTPGSDFPYLALLAIGKDKEYPGADTVSQWYHRNLLIATNIARLSQGSGERILVVIGAGHAKLLREFLSEVPGFEVVDCLRYLK
jgi:pheromone shutdown protein TraB